MQRERNENLDIDGKRTAERRFRYVPGHRELSPAEKARLAFDEQLSEAERELVSAWVRYAFVPTQPGTGWEYGGESGRISAREAADLCGQETTVTVSALAMAGALLFRRYWPVRSTANNDGSRFVFAAEYVGIEDGSPQWAELANLIAELP
jgi:hypothetical protein